MRVLLEPWLPVVGDLVRSFTDQRVRHTVAIVHKLLDPSCPLQRSLHLPGYQPLALRMGHQVVVSLPYTAHTLVALKLPETLGVGLVVGPLRHRSLSGGARGDAGHVGSTPCGAPFHLFS
jgi:hypothetical protein